VCSQATTEDEIPGRGRMLEGGGRKFGATVEKTKKSIKKMGQL